MMFRNHCPAARRAFSSGMPKLPLLACAGASLLFSGCGYVHFGRVPTAGTGYIALQQANADLKLEQKILKQELELAHKEEESLRAALERATVSAAAPSEVAQQLDRTTRELAQLRVDYSRLQAERSTTAGPAGSLTATQAAALQGENAQLKRELASSRAENAKLADQLSASVAEAQQAQASLSQLNLELIDQKEARAKAEQATGALRAQLEAVMARASGPGASGTRSATAPSIGGLSGSGAEGGGLSALQSARERPSDAAATVSLRTNAAQARAVAAQAAGESRAAAGSAAKPVSEPAERTYVVQPGDTLEKIANKVYGSAEQWSKLYDANAQLLGSGQGLRAGMKLRIPAP
jgi:nucleoid-associated protein YgaU